jgi:general secretion pathway protein G
MRRRKYQSGLTLIELIVAFTILMLLSAMAVPLARHKVRRDKERELRQALKELRIGIDKYKDACDAGKLGQAKVGTECYPETLEILVEGAKQAGASEVKMKFLRRLPRDPFTASKEWGMRAVQDDPTSLSWGGQNVFDVYTKTMEKAPDGTAYSEW